MGVLTVYPDAGTGGTTVDGWVERNPAAESFATIRSGAGTGNSPSGGTLDTAQLVSASSTTYIYFRRSIILFDTSALADDAVISAAVLSLYGVGKLNDHGGTMDIAVVSSAPAANNNLQNSDFNIANFGTTVFASIAYASISTSGYNDLTLNASGIANISKTGVSKFGTRFKTWDIDNGYDGSGVLNSQSIFYCYSADVGGTSADPKLVITTGSTYTRDCNETLTLVQTFTKSTSRSFSETLTLVQTFSKALAKSLSETLILVQTFSRGWGRSFSETLILVQTFNKSISKPLNETLTLVQTFTKSISRSLSETLTLVQTFTKSISRSFALTLTLIESFTKVTTYARTFNETLTLVQTFSKSIGKRLNETITLSDTLSKLFDKIWKIPDILNLSGDINKPEGRITNKDNADQVMEITDKDKPTRV